MVIPGDAVANRAGSNDRTKRTRLAVNHGAKFTTTLSLNKPISSSFRQDEFKNDSSLGWQDAQVRVGQTEFAGRFALACILPYPARSLSDWLVAAPQPRGKLTS